ncbi:MAG: gamma-glutamyl-gamma-aminobutyrate hydrolase family protein, partial [bacterium]|nr:gamma-glutamyl-gamma-aminobutyrate hydrolase family protein [bacterium]
VVSESRDDFEFRLVRKFFETRKPILAICRGTQLVNVLLGGTLIQDLPAQAGISHHAQTSPADCPVHGVEFRDDSRLAHVFGAKMIEVNSTHHQAVEKLGEELCLSGWSEEGVVEAFEHRIHPFLIGVQWHPERLAEARNDHQKLFDDFVRAAALKRDFYE